MSGIRRTDTSRIPKGYLGFIAIQDSDILMQFGELYCPLLRCMSMYPESVTTDIKNDDPQLPKILSVLINQSNNTAFVLERTSALV